MPWIEDGFSSIHDENPIVGETDPDPSPFFNDNSDPPHWDDHIDPPTLKPGLYGKLLLQVR
ncbi:MAG: hypothetical protein WB791_03570 [Waddliaceae bacterium]